jgi:hypothetical protein
LGLGELCEAAGARHTKTDLADDVVSLALLIDRVRKYPHALSRDRYVTRTAAWQSRAQADLFFDQMVGEGRDYIDRNVARGDGAKLKTRTKPILKWVNNEVAHYNEHKGTFGLGLTLGEIHDAAKLVIDLSIKYRELILGSSMSKTVAIHPWTGPFTVPWIPERDHHQAVIARISRVEQSREEGAPLAEEDWLL